MTDSLRVLSYFCPRGQALREHGPCPRVAESSADLSRLLGGDSFTQRRQALQPSRIPQLQREQPERTLPSINRAATQERRSYLDGCRPRSHGCRDRRGDFVQLDLPFAGSNGFLRTIPRGPRSGPRLLLAGLPVPAPASAALPGPSSVRASLLQATSFCFEPAQIWPLPSPSPASAGHLLWSLWP